MTPYLLYTNFFLRNFHSFFKNNSNTEDSDGDTDEDLSQLSSILRKKQTSTRIQLQQPLPQTYVQELPKIDEGNEEEKREVRGSSRRSLSLSLSSRSDSELSNVILFLS